MIFTGRIFSPAACVSTASRTTHLNAYLEIGAMEGILAMMIPVLALATGFVAVLRMPPESFARKRQPAALPAADNAALLEEVAALREELAQVRERVDFTERLLMDAAPAPRLPAPAQADPLAVLAPTHAAPAHRTAPGQ